MVLSSNNIAYASSLATTNIANVSSLATYEGLPAPGSGIPFTYSQIGPNFLGIGPLTQAQFQIDPNLVTCTGGPVTTTYTWTLQSYNFSSVPGNGRVQLRRLSSSLDNNTFLLQGALGADELVTPVGPALGDNGFRIRERLTQGFFANINTLIGNGSTWTVTLVITWECSGLPTLEAEYGITGTWPSTTTSFEIAPPRAI